MVEVAEMDVALIRKLINPNNFNCLLALMLEIIISFAFEGLYHPGKALGQEFS